MENEIEKLRKEREAEIKWKNAASLERQEEQASVIVPSIFAILGFLQGCSSYIKIWSGNGNGSKSAAFFSFFYFLIGLGLGALIGWILVKVIFALIRLSK